MTLSTDIVEIATRIAETAAVIPLQRAIRHEWPAIETLRARGVTTAHLAIALGQAGVRQANGAMLTDGHLRQILMRLRKETSPPRAREQPDLSRISIPVRPTIPGQNDTAAQTLFDKVGQRDQEDERRQAARPDFSRGLWGARTKPDTGL